jgi:pilus assembly protein CpaC
MANRVRPLYAGSLIILLAIAGSTTVIWAQGAPNPVAAVAAATASGAAAAPPAGAAAEVEPGAVRLTVGRSAVLNVGTPITRVSLTSSDVADAMVTSPGQLLINGKVPGTISMFVWDKSGSLKRYEVQVQRDLSRLTEQMNELFPKEHISVHSNGRNVVLSGQVSNKDLIDKAVNVAAGYVDKKEEVTTLLQVNSGPPTQVLLRVRFAEVSRSAMTDLGASIFTSANGINNNTIGRVTTQQYAAPAFDNSSDPAKLQFSDFLNFFLFSKSNDLGIVIKALQSRGLFQSLAEPNLVAESGKEASFLAGGEFPVPVVQGSGAALAINVVFKEFGIRLNFTPEVIEDRVHLKVRPEVSTLDFANAVTLQGFRIPALSTRRTETELELQDRQTFAISGLLNNSVASTLSKVPGIGDIPILGYLFKSKAAQKDQTELVVMITPEILKKDSVGVTNTLPRGSESFIAPIPENKLAPVQPEAFESSRRGASLEAPAAPETAQTAQKQPSQPKPEQAAAKVSALTPSTTKKMADAAPAKSAAPAQAASKPLSESEKKELERAKKADQAHQQEQARAEAKAKADEQKRLEAQAVADKHAAELKKEQDARAAREQAKRDADAQKKAEEDAKRELARQREQQRAMDDAAAQLKAAQDRYDSVAKGTKQ